MARVLTRGRLADVRELGLRTIHFHLPDLLLPPQIRRFWEWYFALPDVETRYGPLDAPTA